MKPLSGWTWREILYHVPGNVLSPLQIFIFIARLSGTYYYLHFTYKESEVQKVYTT